MISIFLILILVVIGYGKPKTTGWILLATSPLLIGINSLIIYKDATLPIRWEQIIFAASIGIALSGQYRKRIRDVFLNVWPIFFFCIYILVSIVYGLIDPHETLFKWFMLQQYPAYFAAIILSFSMVQSYDDLLKFKKIILFSLIIIIFLILFEMITKFNISNYLCFINPEVCDFSSLHFNYINESYVFGISDVAIRRYAGYTGDPNTTAIILAIYMVFIVHSLLVCEKKYLCTILILFLSLCISILVIGQTRAAIFSLLLVLITYSLFKYKLLKYLIFVCVFLFFSYLFIDDLNSYVNLFIENRLANDSVGIDSQRLSGLTKSLNVIKESLGMGVGGTIFSVSEKYLNSDDATGYILHFLVGGISLGMIYLVFLMSMIYDLVKTKQGKDIQKTHKLLIEMAILALIIGMMTQVFNENSIIFYILLLYSTTRSSLFFKEQQKNKSLNW